MLRSLICRYRKSPPNLKACLRQILERVSAMCHVLLYCPVALILRPKLKPIWPLNEIGGTDCHVSGPELIMPSVPGPVTKPRLESCTAESVGWLLTDAVRVKSTRASFTIEGPKSFVLASTACCVRFGVKLPKLPNSGP